MVTWENSAFVAAAVGCPRSRPDRRFSINHRDGCAVLLALAMQIVTHHRKV